MSTIPGLLAIWSTVDATVETDYLHWLTREHVFERVAIPGFRSGRVLRRQASAPSEYLILYALEAAAVMGSAHYQARLNQPTPWTQRVMPTLQTFRRGGGEVVAQAGTGAANGSQVAVLRLSDSVPTALRSAEAATIMARLAQRDRVVKLQLMEVFSEGTGIATREKAMRRGEEGVFAGVLLIEALDATALMQTVHAAAVALALPEEGFELYEQLFSWAGEGLSSPPG